MLILCKKSTGEMLKDAGTRFFGKVPSDTVPARSGVPVKLRFYADDLVTPVLLEAGSDVHLDCKPPRLYDLPSFILSLSDFTAPSDAATGFYTGWLDTDKTEANELLNKVADPNAPEPDSVSLMAQLCWKEPGAPKLARGGKWTIILDNSIRNNAEGAPTPATPGYITGSESFEALTKARGALQVGAEGAIPLPIATGVPDYAPGHLTLYADQGNLYALNDAGDPPLRFVFAGEQSADALSPLLTAETVLSAATTIDATALGRAYVCAGTVANYTVTLPNAAGNEGKSIRLRMAPALTRLVTLDAGAGRLIDGQQTRVMQAGECATLFCDGTGWTKTAGKTIPFAVTLRRTSAQAVGTGAWTQIVLPTRLEGSALMHDTANGRVSIPRGGTYQCTAFLQRNSSSAADVFAVNTARNGALPDDTCGGNVSSNGAVGGANNTTHVACAAGDWLALATIFFGAAGDVLAVGTAYPQLTVTERASW